MEIVKTTEDTLVLACLKEMLTRAQDQRQAGKQSAANDRWEEHIKVISQAIHNAKVNMLEAELH